jgi:tRNA A-37 threonylcarbamoyl transferase component Bud32
MEEEHSDLEGILRKIIGSFNSSRQSKREEERIYIREPLSLERRLRDSDELSDYVIDYFGNECGRKKGKEFLYLEDNMDRIKPIEKIHLKENDSLYNFIDKKEFNEINKYNIIKDKKLDYIISNNFESKTSDKNINPNYYSEGILSLYKDLGYEKVREDISPDNYAEVPEEAVSQKPQKVEVTHEGLPAEYKPLLADLSQKHPGIRYASMTKLVDKSQHNVDIIKFEYEEKGEVKQLTVVAKDWNEKEEALPQFLNDLGIRTHSLYDLRTRLFMQHVGERELRSVVKEASEEELLRVCTMVLDKMAQIHVTGTAHLQDLRQNHDFVFEPIDYNDRFKSRFIEPVSGNSIIVSPQANRLMQAYSAFMKIFDPSFLIHGDFHTGNCRVTSDECFVYDFELATDHGEKFRDLSRFTNSITRDRPDLDAADLTREMLAMYVDKHNTHSEREGAAFMRYNPQLATALRCGLIEDYIDKTGGAIIFAAEHPRVKDEQMQKCQLYFENSVRMLDGAINMADSQKDYYTWETLSNLRSALVDFTATSPVQFLKETAQKYQAHSLYKEPVILVPN